MLGNDDQETKKNMVATKGNKGVTKVDSDCVLIHHHVFDDDKFALYHYGPEQRNTKQK